MISGLKPYPEYKETELAWLGNIPSKWQIIRGKSILNSVDERSEFGQEELLTVSSSRGVILRRNAKVTMFMAKSYIDYKICWIGDLVINSLWAWAGGLGVSPHHGIVSTAYSVFRPKTEMQINSGYLHELVRSKPFHWELLVRSKGVWISRLQLSDTAFLDIRFPLPPPSEQAAIVRFLDWANGRLDRAIAAKRKIVALLSEQKQAIIHRAVTRGLDPNVRLKDSGVAWLGEIPEHWKVSRIKNEFLCLNWRRIPLDASKRGGMTSRLYEYYGASGVIDKVENYIFDEELLLIAEDGANLVLRNLPLIIIARGKYWVNNHAHILKVIDGDILFYSFLLESLNYQPWISGAAQPKLTRDRLMSISIAVAPFAEQTKIASQITSLTRPLSATISRLEREITLLREYRTRLVSDVVTGKLDVREAALRLPKEAPVKEELQSSDDSIDMELDEETIEA